MDLPVLATGFIPLPGKTAHKFLKVTPLPDGRVFFLTPDDPYLQTPRHPGTIPGPSERGTQGEVLLASPEGTGPAAQAPRSRPLCNSE